MRVLISGAGIAGPTVAYWLRRYGMEPVLVERAPELRTGGYIVDFWGAGFRIAERMGLRPELERRGYIVREVRVVNREGQRVTGFEGDVFERLAGGRYVSVPRGVLAEAIYRALQGRVETILGDSIAALQDGSAGVRATFESGRVETFDLVIGADGLHSRVREIVFGPESWFERFLGYGVAAFTVRGYRPRDELTYVMFTEVGRQMARFAMRDDRTLFLLVFRDERDEARTCREPAAQRALLHRIYRGAGWEAARILEALDGCDDLYFDRVSQIHMGTRGGAWSRGRVALLGDAASCVSLLAGEGAGLAMTGAYILAGELHAAGRNFGEAFRRYEERFGAFAARKQAGAQRSAGAFAPASALALVVRNAGMALLDIPGFAELVLAQSLRDEIEIPDYGSGCPPVEEAEAHEPR